MLPHLKMAEHQKGLQAYAQNMQKIFMLRMYATLTATKLLSYAEASLMPKVCSLQTASNNAYMDSPHQ